MQIDIYTVCKNEAMIAPFIADYWKSVADDVNVFVYDEMSEDGTREYLSSLGFVTVIDNPTDGLDDNNHVMIKNNCWKHSRGKADFVIVCDFDEVLFSWDVESLRKSLDAMKFEGRSILAPLSFNVVSDSFPVYDGRYLHEICRYGFNDYVWYTKPILFDPDMIEEINYVHGAHCCHPVGDIRWYNPNDVFLVHCKYLGFEYYRDRVIERKLSEYNKSHGMFAEQEKDEEGLRIVYDDAVSRRFDWSDVKENFKEYYKTKHDWSRWSMGVL